MAHLIGGAMFRRWVIGLSVGLSVVLGMIVLVPRAFGMSKGEWLTWENIPNCKLPCWRGIMPGKTTFGEAEKILREYPDVKFVMFQLPDGEPTWLGNFLLRTPYTIVFGQVQAPPTLNIDQQLVSEIRFSIPRGIAVVPVIDNLGAPLKFHIDHRSNDSTTTLYWRQGVTIEIGLYEDRTKLVCNNQFDGLRTHTIHIEEKSRIPPFAKEWTGYEGLKNALCIPSE